MFFGLFFAILFYSIFCPDINKGFLHLIAWVKPYYMNCLIEGLVFLLVYWKKLCLITANPLDASVLTYESTIRYFIVAQETKATFSFLFTQKNSSFLPASIIQYIACDISHHLFQRAKVSVSTDVLLCFSSSLDWANLNDDIWMHY